jgi:mercuric ion binding protein
MKKLFAALALAAVVAPVWAATQTVTLSVPGMTCASADHCQARAFQG